jgi:uncharacterized protein (DUF169 family)
VNPNLRDYSVFNRFDFERKPVGVKFRAIRPEGIKKLEKSLNICEMIKEAQTSSPFYVSKGDFHCIEPIILGMEDTDPGMVSGMIGEIDGLFEEARANRKLYQYLPRMVKGSVNHVLFSSIDQLTFDPDVLIVTANVSQAKTLLRALVYSTGEMWSTKGTPVAACAWIYVYPVISGEVNFTVTGLSMGMGTLKVFPEGLLLISIPWTKLPMIMENLSKMNWSPISDTVTGEDHKTRVNQMFNDIRRRMQGEP